jgi:hypothetical protein
MATETGNPGKVKELEDRIKRLEARLDRLLTAKVELDVKELTVAPRSKLRVSCE